MNKDNSIQKSTEGFMVDMKESIGLDKDIISRMILAKDNCIKQNIKNHNDSLYEELVNVIFNNNKNINVRLILIESIEDIAVREKLYKYYISILSKGLFAETLRS